MDFKTMKDRKKIIIYNLKQYFTKIGLCDFVNTEKDCKH